MASSAPLTTTSAAEGFTAINVGFPPVQVFVHRPLLNSSEFSRTRSKTRWNTGAAVDLPDVGMHTFNVYVSWLYSRKLPTIVDEADIHPAACGFEWEALASAYVLGEMLLDAAFQDTVFDSIRRKKCNCSEPLVCPGRCRAADKLFSETTDNSIGRKWAIEVVVEAMKKRDDVDATGLGLSQELVKEACTLRCLRGQRRMFEYEGTACSTYHCHGEDEECYLVNERRYMADELYALMERNTAMVNRAKVLSWICRR
ncbi:hypothetical protein LTR09_011883 [Extremus antarcticus]|uniref:BTB domain-containing protein n=1 Tax=Extremus antarcticus TaxID=702011 RepID=A0AAJ0G477_9PEZI|nr:hypothetical protein LTR09_011883 [Extremus antarcticus]